MSIDKYWDKFISDGKIESYLNYKQHLTSQDSFRNDTNGVYDRRTDNQRTEYRG